ncbi:hypothetical protein [Limnovirga soli]|uniref:DUF916 domain-containing protein n=1 Tax=Limnovirga soli TaxID=2656915 RepID=A0A8J8FI89_9BACT|nr:hypothetical protein [Limnovirga soli]NNV55554.1 hypothetical protein [Limnovirga soli]
MKKHNQLYILIALLSCLSFNARAQATKNDLVLNLSYYNNNNQSQYVMVHAKSKIDGKFQQIPGIDVRFYITSDSSSANLLGKAITNEKGEAFVLIPPSAKDEWNKSANQSFIAVAQASKLYDETKTNVDIVKAKLQIDTSADKVITAKLLALNDTVWLPVTGVDVKVAVKRLDGNLNVNETETYTTDSTGTVTAEYKRDSLPGDAKGILTLIATIEDNDVYGNLTVEKAVPWGATFQNTSVFDKRTLFARRGHSPIWLELMAYSIILAVWLVIFYLIMQFIKIKKLGRLAD